MWFELLLPGLDADGAPIPLGGTSNHFLTARLRELGAWDPYNVTEDADLGIRLHKAGYRTAMVDSTTLEEANSDLGNWIRQRSRWIKGYIQTYLVHMRNPFLLMKQAGFKGFMSFQLVVGGTFIFLLNPIFWLLTTVFFITRAEFIQAMFPTFVFYLAALMLFVGNFIFLYLNVAGSVQRGLYGLAKYALISPLYWGLMSLAAWKGFIQLVTNPFYWEKTTHGLDTPGGAHAGTG
jgi:cellulose synthase/poly-beta-1,6-N-acetylglucosamine synthase-like glycosyltransferase